MTPITTQAEAEQAIGDFAAVIEKLSGIIEKETTLVRAGHLRRPGVWQRSCVPGGLVTTPA